MPEDNNPNYSLLLEKIDNLEKKVAAYEEKLQQVTEFNRQLLERRKPEQQPEQENADVEAAKKKLEKFLEG